MILLTLIAAVFHEMTSGAVLQFDVITSGGAAGGATMHPDRVIALLLYISCAAHDQHQTRK